MKRLIAVILLAGFSIAVCHAVPYDTGFTIPQKEFALKKQFELQACELPAVIEVPAAPEVVYDLVVCEVAQTVKVVRPQANSPPANIKALRT